SASLADEWHVSGSFRRSSFPRWAANCNRAASYVFKKNRGIAGSANLEIRGTGDFHAPRESRYNGPEILASACGFLISN
ncbi:MAG: hypothetical protein ACRD41_15975, partial [Candidatus Acidiferrales bacterium]